MFSLRSKQNTTVDSRYNVSEAILANIQNICFLKY